MPTSPASVPRPLPHWVILSGSAFIAFHFLALAAIVLAAPSGPWPANSGPMQVPGPPFAVDVNQVTSRYYLRPLHMDNDYHFIANVPSLPSVYFEVRLKDKTGAVQNTLKFPDDNANAWVRHRQKVLAQWLGFDVPVQPLQGEQVLPP